MFYWTELIPLICGNYAVGLEYEDVRRDSSDDGVIPVLCQTKDEVIAEIEDMKRCYNDQILEGEREEGDLWEGECHKVLFTDDQRLYLVDDNDQPTFEIDWKSQL